jgi:hypothetical protein
MQIDFYEEFPTQENLEKLRLIKYPIRLFVAAKSLEKFRGLEKKVKQIKRDVELSYWPIINNSYWISPFSNIQDLKKLFRQLEKTDYPLLIDLELPQNKRLIRKNLSRFFKNKKIIREFIEENKERITIVEFPASAISLPMKMLGLDYNVKTQKSLMWYSSINSRWINQHIKKSLERIKYKEDYSISLGTIATGILGNEQILSPENLEEDLEFVAQSGFNKIVIFRLAGLNEDYIKIIESFQD